MIRRVNTLAQRKGTDAHVWVVNPALGGVILQQAHLRYGLARSSTSTSYNKRTHIKTDMDLLVYTQVIHIHS